MINVELSRTPVGVVRPGTWADAIHVGKQLTRWAFRGQAFADWALSSALERAAIAADMPFDLLANRERWMLIQFARRAHHYLSDPPDPARHVEWLALIQHHGGPTRLLDFTSSYYVAAFFALDVASEDSAIWAVNLRRLEDRADARLGVVSGPKSTIHDRYQQYLAAAEQCIDEQEGPRLVYPVIPTRLNERLSIQQGLFLMGMDSTTSFLANLAGTLDLSPDQLQPTVDLKPEEISIIDADRYLLIKIVLPVGLRLEALKDLWRMNISAATLFPGLDGFARSLADHVKDPILTNARIRQAQALRPPEPSAHDAV